MAIEFVAPTFEPEIFRKQIYCIELLVTLLGLFGDRMWQIATVHHILETGSKVFASEGAGSFKQGTEKIENLSNPAFSDQPSYLNGKTLPISQTGVIWAAELINFDSNV